MIWDFDLREGDTCSIKVQAVFDFGRLVVLLPAVSIIFEGGLVDRELSKGIIQLNRIVVF